jgi:DNA invertase Pin-like site-specific DNA recombinase
MRTRYRDAHLRMLESLPKRTHYREERPRLPARQAPPPSSPAMLERRERVRQLRAEGMTWDEIAAELEISRTAAFDAYNGPRRQRPITIERRERVRQMRAAGKTYSAIACALKLSRTAVANHVNALKAEEQQRNLTRLFTQRGTL